MGKEKRVFLSYKREDQVFASKLKADLEAQGIFSWIDVNEIAAGEAWDHEIEQALKKTEILLVLLTPESAASPNVMDEVSFALSTKKKVIPVMVRNCEVPFRLHRRQRIDMTGDYTFALQQLIQTIRNEKPTTPIPSSGKTSFFAQRYFIIPLLMACLLLMVYYYSGFKGILYNQWELSGDSVLRLTFINRSPQPDSNFMVTATINDSTSLKHNFASTLHFDEMPSNPKFKKMAEDFGSGDTEKHRTALQPILENGKYIVEWPVKKRANTAIEATGIDFNFATFDYRLNVAKPANAKLRSWHDWSAASSVFIFIVGLGAGILILLLINKNRKV
jgi:hypothetical protein